MSDMNEVLAGRTALVSEYSAIVTQLENTPAMYTRLDEIKAELAEGEAAAAEAFAAAGYAAPPTIKLPTPPDVRVVVPQVKESEIRTARLRWILENQGEEGVSASAPEGEVSAFAQVVASTSRKEEGGGDAYGILSGFARAEYCTDNGERGADKRRFFVNTENEHVAAWLGL